MENKGVSRNAGREVPDLAGSSAASAMSAPGRVASGGRLGVPRRRVRRYVAGLTHLPLSVRFSIGLLRTARVDIAKALFGSLFAVALLAAPGCLVRRVTHVHALPRWPRRATPVWRNLWPESTRGAGPLIRWLPRWTLRPRRDRCIPASSRSTPTLRDLFCWRNHQRCGSWDRLRWCGRISSTWCPTATSSGSTFP